MTSKPEKTVILQVLVALSGFSFSEIAAFAESVAKPLCPLVEKAEKTEDCPWAGAARVLQTVPEARLHSILPKMEKSIQRDGKRDFIRSAWGQSINFDELAKGEIVTPKILAELEQQFGMKAAEANEPKTAKGFQIARHAGLEHTYGYLLSTLQTAFGYKRARWVSGEIDKGFGFPAGTIAPQPKGSTLLANATFLAGRIAFRKEPKRLADLLANFKDAPKALRDLDLSKLKTSRLLEETSGGVQLRTDLVTFPNPQANSQLLVYSVVDPASSTDSKLITAFPVMDNFASGVFDPAKLGDNQPVVTRYNAYVPAITDSATPLMGKRIRIDD